jgi:chromosomal replication initiation ATPase DnaA
MLGSPRAHLALRAWQPPCGGATYPLEQHLRPILEHAVAAPFAVTRSALWRTTRGSPAEAFARQVAMYLAHVGLGLSYTAVGGLFGRDRRTVAHACAVVEDRRDAAVLDRTLDLLEGAVRLLAGRQA